MSDVKTIINVVVAVIIIIALIFASIVIYNRFFGGGGGGSPGRNTDPGTPMANGDYIGQIIYNSGGTKNLGDIFASNLHNAGQNFAQLNIYWSTNANGEIRFPSGYPARAPSNFKVIVINVGTGTVRLTQGINLLCPYEGNCWGTGEGNANSTGPYWMLDDLLRPGNPIVGCMNYQGNATRDPGEGTGSIISVTPFRVCELISCNYSYNNTWWPVQPQHLIPQWVVRPRFSTDLAWINGNANRRHIVW